MNEKLRKLYLKLFPTKCFIVSGNSVPAQHFSHKKAAQRFLFDNCTHGYTVMIECVGTGVYRA